MTDIKVGVCEASSKQKTSQIHAPPHETNLFLMRMRALCCQHICSALLQSKEVIYPFFFLFFFFFPSIKTEKCEQVESQGLGWSKEKWHAYQLTPPCQMCTGRKQEQEAGN